MHLRDNLRSKISFSVSFCRILFSIYFEGVGLRVVLISFKDDLLQLAKLSLERTNYLDG